MKETTKKKGFDCLAFKRRVQAEIYKDIKNMSFKDEVGYFEQRAQHGQLGAWWKRVKGRHAPNAHERA